MWAFAQSEACSIACKTSVAENACFFYDRVQPRTLEASKELQLRAHTSSPYLRPRCFGEFLFLFFGGGTFLVPAFELFLEGCT